MNRKPIPIRNIYYMLCYAWDTLKSYEPTFLGQEKFDNIYNLFARIYIDDTTSLIKRGISRYYIPYSEDLSVIRGKINISNSIKNNTMTNRQLNCEFEVFSDNIKLNQIVKTTISTLINIDSLDQELRKTLIQLRLHFINTNEIQLSKSLFSTLKFNKNNIHYRMLINISELIYLGLVTNEDDNLYQFMDFINDHQMAKLYEKFVLNFYKKHLENYKVHAPIINWDLDKKSQETDLSFLPEMRTDIVIEDSNTQLIIDTKYYTKTFTQSNLSDHEKIRNSHLYQIYSYINNSSFAGQINGMLLYPTIKEDYNLKYRIGGKNISINTLNLNSDWEDIHNKLLSIIS